VKSCLEGACFLLGRWKEGAQQGNGTGRGEREMGLANVKLFASCVHSSTLAGCRSSGSHRGQGGGGGKGQVRLCGSRLPALLPREQHSGCLGLGLCSRSRILRAGGTCGTSSGSWHGIDVPSPR